VSLAPGPARVAAHAREDLLRRRQKRYPEVVAILDEALAPAPERASALPARALLPELRGGGR
jgi:hypothetical protein